MKNKAEREQELVEEASALSIMPEIRGEEEIWLNKENGRDFKEKTRADGFEWEVERSLMNK